MIQAECQQTRELLDSFLSAELLVETNHQILWHLARCDSCRIEMNRRQGLRALMKAALPAQGPPAALIERVSQIPRRPDATPRAPLRARVLNVWGRLVHGRHTTMTSAARPLRGGWMRQTAVGTVVTTVVLVLGMVAPWRPAPVTAAELLSQSDLAFRLATTRSDVVLHRSLYLEERRGRQGPVVSRRRIEVWRNPNSGLTTRRAFDDRNVLIAGEWQEQSGARTLYRSGAPPVLGAQPPDAAQLAADDAWRIDLSATAYASFVSAPASAHVEAAGDRFLLRYEAPPESGATLISATLTLRQATLHPIEQTIVIQQDGDVREYVLSEARFNTVQPDAVNAAVFEPEPLLVGTVVAVPIATGPPVPLAAPPAAVSPSADAEAALPSAEIELEAIYRLHRAEAWLRDLPSVIRSPDGTSLAISARVAGEERRSELMTALGHLSSVPGVSVTVVVDPLHPSPADAAPNPAAELGSMAAYDTLRAHFVTFIASRVPAAERPNAAEEAALVDGLVKSLAARTLERSHEALRRASVLEMTADRFARVPSSDLTPDAEATWQTMLRDHARAIEHRLESLRLELQPIVALSLASEAGPEEPSPGGVELSQTAVRLTQLLADADGALRRAFGASIESSSPANLADPVLWQTLAAAERLAMEIQRPRSLRSPDGPTRRPERQ